MNQEHAFSQNDVYEFLKLLVETGGVHYVDANYTIYRTEDRTPVGVRIGNGKDNRKQIALFKEGCRPPENAVYLNPFDELLGDHPDRDWFLNMLAIIPGCLALYSMKSMSEMITNKTKDVDIKSAEVLAPFVDKVDKKFVDELQKLRPVDVGLIFYDKQKHIAQLLCDFWEEEFENKMKSKVRKSSLKTMREMLAAIYKTETPHEMTHTSTLVPYPKFDAVVHVLSMCLTRMTDVVEKVTDIKLRANELEAHLEHLEAYHKALQWLATSTTSKPANEQVTGDAPWTVAPAGTANITGAAPVGAAPVAPVSSGSSDFLRDASVVGVTRNPNYGGAGVVTNPTFGIGAASFAPVVPTVPSMGGIAPVVPKAPTFDASSFTSQAYDSLSFGSGFAGGFL